MQNEYLTISRSPNAILFQKASDLPVWNFDGSSTDQAVGANSDVFLYPVALFDDPFRGKPNKMVLCETYSFDDKPTCSNCRKTCNEVMNTEAVQVSKYVQTKYKGLWVK